MKNFVKFILIVFLHIKCYADDIPSFIHVCHRDDPDLEKCLINSVEDLRPYLVTGVPEFHIPSIEPLILHDFLSEEAGGMKITTSNVTAFGCSDFFVRKIAVDDLETHKYSLDIDIPKLRIEAHVNIDGKLLLLPVKGNGHLEANVTDCISKTVLQGELYEKNGDTYLKFTSVSIKISVGGGLVRINQLFNGDKVLLGIINDVVNKNLDVFLQQLLPAIERELSAVFMDISNKIVEPFTYKQLFPH